MIRPFARTQFVGAILALSVIALAPPARPLPPIPNIATTMPKAWPMIAPVAKARSAVRWSGGTFGAIIGKVVGGNKGTGIGALIGGSTGAVVGTDRENRRYEAIYQDAYADCMQRASNTAQPTAAHSAYAPEPWTEEWYDYCAAKYRSFNPETGEFLAYSGEYKQCR